MDAPSRLVAAAPGAARSTASSPTPWTIGLRCFGPLKRGPIGADRALGIDALALGPDGVAILLRHADGEELDCRLRPVVGDHHRPPHSADGLGLFYRSGDVSSERASELAGTLWTDFGAGPGFTNRLDRWLGELGFRFEAGRIEPQPTGVDAASSTRRRALLDAWRSIAQAGSAHLTLPATLLLAGDEFLDDLAVLGESLRVELSLDGPADVAAREAAEPLLLAGCDVRWRFGSAEKAAPAWWADVLDDFLPGDALEFLIEWPRGSGAQLEAALSTLAARAAKRSVRVAFVPSGLPHCAIRSPELRGLLSNSTADEDPRSPVEACAGCGSLERCLGPPRSWLERDDTPAVYPLPPLKRDRPATPLGHLAFAVEAKRLFLGRWVLGSVGIGPQVRAPAVLRRLSNRARPRRPEPVAATPRDEVQAVLERVRDRLSSDPDDVIRLGDVAPAHLLRTTPCHEPWTRLELSVGKFAGPCCKMYQSAPEKAQLGTLLQTWNGPYFQEFRRSMTRSSEPESCRPTCAILQGKKDRPDRLQLRGGPPAFIDNQLQIVEDLLMGRAHSTATPLQLCYMATSYCNYDCVMCRYGETGTLDDEQGEAFYAELLSMLPRMSSLDVVGGEPLASPHFRDFLVAADRARFPQLRVSITTNGSFLTPKFQQKIAGVRFEMICVSINAASPETYLAVNQGLSWDRIRTNLDELLRRRAAGDSIQHLEYSTVLLQRNLHEIEAFAELGIRDGIEVRYRLPNGNRNQQSILVDPDAMATASEALERAATTLRQAKMEPSAKDATTAAAALRRRLDAKVFTPLV